MRFLKTFSALFSLLGAGLGSSVAAQQVEGTDVSGLDFIGVPVAGATEFQPATTELARELQWLDQFILILMTGVVIVVLGLILYVVLRFRYAPDREPAKFSHYTPVEVIWTVVPVFILIVIGWASLPVLFKQQTIPEGDITIKATGYQWYWGYEYVDEGFSFDSLMIGAGVEVLTPEVEAELIEAGYAREHFLLATDNAVVIPVGKTVVIQVTAADVIHSWTIPAFGVKQDGIPGRLAALWFEAEEEGVYFGQCSELCGKSHAFMPITVKVVSEEVYAQWLDAARAEFASVIEDGAPREIMLAAN